MTTALVGLLGVALGLVVGFGYRFWAKRRDELGEALLAMTALHEAARALLRDPGAQAERLAMQEVWRDHGSVLILHMTPTDYESVAKAVAKAAGGRDRGASERVLQLSGELRDVFWSEHQAFILTPYARYFAGDTLSKRITAVIARHLE